MQDKITVYKCDHNGEVVLHYEGIVAARDETSICITAWFEHDPSDLGFVRFDPGDQFTEWFYSDRWYNIFRVEDGATGTLKGWYCNITRPASITSDSIRADDLALDLFVLPTGGMVLMDEEEFSDLGLSLPERMASLRAVEAIRDAVAQRSPPFDEIRTGTGPLT
jgi:hypothetical protein